MAIKSALPMKRPAKWMVAGVGVTATLLLVILFLLGRDQSVYSAGYSEAQFRSLRVGMERSEVERLLGPPLQAQPDSQPAAWWYGERGRPPGELVVSEPQVVKFDRDGRVSERRGPLLEKVEIGMSTEDVLKIAGAPDRQTPRSAVVAHYSMPGPSGRYRARIVTYDDRGIVAKITAFSMWD